MTRGREGLQIKYFVCEYGIRGADFLSRFFSGGNVHGFCFSRPRWLGQKESPRAQGKDRFWHEIFTAEKPLLGSSILSTSEPISPPHSYANSAKFSAWGLRLSLAKLGWDFLCDFSQFLLS